MSVYVLLLAAGASHRFGAPKHLQHWQGRPLLTHMAERAEAVAPGRVRVVLGAHATKLRPLLSAQQVLINAQWQQGMGSSLAFGVSQLPSQARGVIVLLADQVAVSLDDLRALMPTGTSIEPRIVCAEYEGVRGAPAYFSNHFFSELAALRGDQGAKVLLTHPVARTVAMPSAAVDIDTVADFEHFQQQREIASATAND